MPKAARFLTCDLENTFCKIPLTTEDSSGQWAFEMDLPPGIYRISAWIDGADFDWESLYFPVHEFNNKGQRTGPWDFTLDTVHPLIPSWHVFRNDEDLGLTFVRRVTVEDLERKRFSLRFLFTHDGGPLAITLRPFRTMAIKLANMSLDAVEVDSLPATVAQTVTIDPKKANYGALRTAAGYFTAVARRLKEIDPRYESVLQKCLQQSLAPLRTEGPAWVTYKSFKTVNPEQFSLWAYAWIVQKDRDALDMACHGIDYYLSLPAWGHPDPSAYGHNGDMAVASLLENLSLAWHDFGPDLGEERSQLLQERLHLQMQVFYRLLLLQHSIWGGSLRQDHGHRSLCRFGVAASNLIGHCPEAPQWLAWVHSEMRKVLILLKEDGGLPVSSHQILGLYVNDMVTWRKVWRSLSGEDIFSRRLFSRIVDFVYNRFDPETNEYMQVSARGDRKEFYTGWSFLNVIAEIHDCPRAAWLTQRLLQRYADRSVPVSPAGTLLAAIEHAGSYLPTEEPFTPDAWDVRPALGLIGYRPTSGAVCLQIQCLELCTSAQKALTGNSSDFSTYVPMEGHFALHLNGKAMVLTAEGGYRMSSDLGNSLLIDGRGGYGDISYPMGVPIMRTDAHFIEATHFDSAEERGYVRLNLGGLYPDANLDFYVREFFLSPDGLRVRDILSAPEEHAYSWNFSSYRRRTFSKIGENHWSIQDEEDAVVIQGRSLSQALRSTHRPVEVVWGYHNEHGGQEFAAIQFETTEPSRRLEVEFQVSWKTD